MSNGKEPGEILLLPLMQATFGRAPLEKVATLATLLSVSLLLGAQLDESDGIKILTLNPQSPSEW